MRVCLKAALLLFVVTLGLVFLGSSASAQPAKQPAAPASAKPFKPVLSIEHMMEGQEKLYTEIKDGILDERWDDARKSAWLLAEIANVNHYQKDDAQYQGFADELSRQSLDLSKVLKKQDANQAKELVAAMGRTCKSCHDQFRKD